MPPLSAPAIVNAIQRMADEMLFYVSVVAPEGSLGNTALAAFP